MKNLQELFNELDGLKKEQKELKASFRDALGHSAEYQESLEKVKQVKAAKATTEDKVRGDFGPEFNRLDEIKNQMAELNMMISDIALNRIMKGERVEVYGPHETQYEPSLSVKFKRKKD